MARHDENVVWHAHPVTQRSASSIMAIAAWCCGSPGFGLGNRCRRAEEALHRLGVSTYLLDGDNVRHGRAAILASATTTARKHSPGGCSGS